MYISQLSDHAHAQYLREFGAIDNYSHIGNLTIWKDPFGKIVSMALYMGNRGTNKTIFTHIPR